MFLVKFLVVCIVVVILLIVAIVVGWLISSVRWVLAIVWIRLMGVHCSISWVSSIACLICLLGFMTSWMRLM